MVSGIIYRVISPSGKKYYGYTSNPLKIRMGQHKKDSKRNKSVFYDSIKKYGFEKFRWEIIESHNAINKKELSKILSEREISWINKDKTHLREYGYNMTLGGDGVLGYRYSEDRKKEYKIKFKGDKNPMYAHFHSDESIQKNRDSNIGRKDTPETIEKKRISHIGKKHKESSKEKIGNAHRGKKYSKKTRDKIRKARTGVSYGPHSEETKRKIGDAHRGKKHPRVKCPYCNKEVTPSTLSRWHNKNCKDYNLTLNNL